MDFRINREIITTGEEVFNKSSEQSVELDYILPDYYPDIFRLVKCTLTPTVVSQSISGDKAIYELAVAVTIWYCGENSRTLQTITQKLNYSKTVDIGFSCDNADIKIKPRCDYVNCRAVNQRRLDIRGAASCFVSVVARKEQSVVCDAFGSGIQLRKAKFSPASQTASSSKSFLVEDEFDLGSSKPAALGVVRSEASITSVDKKIVSGKLVAKGDVSIYLLYLADDGAGGIESMQISIPFSQIIELKDADIGCECIIDAQCTSCDVNISANSDGEEKLVKCAAMISVNAIAQKNSNVEIVTDAYSTEYACGTAVSEICIESSPIRINESHSEKETLECTSEDIECICGAWCSAESVSTLIEDGVLKLGGKIKWNALVKTADSYAMLEKETVFEHKMPNFDQFSSIRTDICADVTSCSYNLASQSSVSIKADLRIAGCVWPVCTCSALTDIIIDDETHDHENDGCALRLYFADNSESAWDIAKKYRTSVSAVMEENDISDADAKCGSMLMIPMVKN